MSFLDTIEQLSFSTWVRESPSLLAYPTVLWLHVMGMGMVAGTSAVISLRRGATAGAVVSADVVWILGECDYRHGSPDGECVHQARRSHVLHQNDFHLRGCSCAPAHAEQGVPESGYRRCAAGER